MKKHLRFTLYVMLGVFAVSCKSTAPTASVQYSSEKDGTITLRAVGTGKTKELAKENAEKNATEILFFRGIPESSQKTPLIGNNEVAIKHQHSSYFEQFYDKKRYLTFVISSQLVGDYSKQELTVEVKINLRSLRADLEERGVIRKFGY